jgi:hypothetical protein
MLFFYHCCRISAKTVRIFFALQALTISIKIRSYNETIRQARAGTMFMPVGMSHYT